MNPMKIEIKVCKDIFSFNQINTLSTSKENQMQNHVA